MYTIEQILEQLQAQANPQIRQILLRHGAQEPVWGVKIEALKNIQKVVKKHHQLSLELYQTGIYDAMYLAGLLADEKKMTRADLQTWVQQSKSQGISEYTVPWIAADSAYGLELGLAWIDEQHESIASAGWSTLASVCSVTPNEQLVLEQWKALLDRVCQDIHHAPNRVRYTMNQFVIAVGCYVSELSPYAMQIATSIGTVNVHVGETACVVPDARSSIQKVIDRGSVGKKKKQARC